MYDIEKGVPVPKTNSGKSAKYPFRAMEVGDSFVVEREAKPLAQRSMYMFNKNNKDRRMIARVQPDGTLRVWRTA